MSPMAYAIGSVFLNGGSYTTDVEGVSAVAAVMSTLSVFFILLVGIPYVLN